jgi:hypothetical protein
MAETNGDEYKKIITRNCCPSWTSRLSIMNIAASTMTLQTNCCDQTFVSIGTFRELQSVSMMDAWKWRNPSCYCHHFAFVGESKLNTNDNLMVPYKSKLVIFMLNEDPR